MEDEAVSVSEDLTGYEPMDLEVNVKMQVNEGPKGKGQRAKGPSCGWVWLSAATCMVDC